MSARVVSLQLHRAHGQRPVAVDAVTGRVGGGLEGDSHVERTTRGVLVVDRSTLDALGLRSGDLREQVTIEGLPGVTALAAGTRLRLGGITLRVNGPCGPCTHIGGLVGVEDVEAFRSALVGRRGAICTVVEAASVARVGDAVEVIPTEAVPAGSGGAISPGTIPPRELGPMRARATTGRATSGRDRQR